MARYSSGSDYEKKLINLREGDTDLLRKHFPNIAYGAIIRNLVEQFVDALEDGRRPSLEFDPNKLDL
ncbi:hypothetical protein [Idiomarina abyssalis]|uniref:hypothetical protein n=1 Tax=Idiomarina abyssalis TaxID=86102 RepID=UPI003A90887D